MSLLHHLVGGRLAHEIAPEQIDLHRALDGFDRHVEKAVEGTDAGVGNHHVDLAECLDCLADKLGRGLGRGDVALHRKPALACGFDFGDAGRGIVVTAVIVDHDICTGLGCTHRRRAADARRCARDEHGLAFQQLH